MKSFFCVIVMLCCTLTHFAQQVDAGNGHAIILDENGEVWTVGRNNFGQLGNGTMENSAIPIKVKGLPKIKVVSRGYDHSMALDYDGNIWLWGCNNYGQLGTWDLNHFDEPIQLSHGKTFIAIEGGHWHSVALADDGSVWSWGHNYFAELGNGTREHSEYPVEAELPAENGKRKTLRDIVEIACVGYHTMALDKNGQLFTWGANNYHELGRSENRREAYAGLVDLPKIVSVAAGWHHSIALDQEGAVWYWGKDQALKYAKRSEQEIPKPTRFSNLPTIVKIASGSWHSLALDQSGQVWGWGRNRYGLLGTGDTVSHSQPVQMPGFENISEIGGGCFQTMAIDNDGNILTCGDNPSGQQGINNHERVFTAEHMLLKTDGILETLPEPEENQSIAKPVLVEENPTSKAISAGLKRPIYWVLSLSLLANIVFLRRKLRAGQ